MSLHNIVIWGAVAVVGFVAVLGLSRPHLVSSVNIDQVKAEILAQLDGALAGTAGPDRFNPCESRNGITQCFDRRALLTGTTTSYAVKTPNATSTPTLAWCRITGGQQVAVAFTWSTGTAMQASTTLLSGSHALAANAQGTFMASTTNAEVTRILAPNSWVQANIMGGVGTASSTGFCQTTFEVI